MKVGPRLTTPVKCLSSCLDISAQVFQCLGMRSSASLAQGVGRPCHAESQGTLELTSCPVFPKSLPLQDLEFVLIYLFNRKKGNQHLGTPVNTSVSVAGARRGNGGVGGLRNTHRYCFQIKTQERMTTNGAEVGVGKKTI